VGGLEARLSEMSKMKDDEEMSRKNAEEMIEKLKQESKDKVCLNISPSLHIVIRPNSIYDNLTIIVFLCLP
jgi:hypothetical protein